MSKVIRKISCGSASVSVYVIPEGETFIPGEVCFHTEEFLWAEKMASGYRATDDRDTFWAGVIESKRANPAYSVYDNFPNEKASMKAPPEKVEPLRPWNAEERARIEEGARAILATLRSARQSARIDAPHRRLA